MLQDLTCDSDGKIKQYVDEQSIESSMPVHEVAPGEEYFLGVFLVGAYQEILGDMHNLFGDTDSVNVYQREDGSYYHAGIETHDTIEDMLRYVHLSPEELMTYYRDKVASAKLSAKGATQFIDALRLGLTRSSSSRASAGSVGQHAEPRAISAASSGMTSNSSSSRTRITQVSQRALGALSPPGDSADRPAQQPQAEEQPDQAADECSPRKNARTAATSNSSPITSAAKLQRRAVHAQRARQPFEKIVSRGDEESEETAECFDDVANHRSENLAQPFENAFHPHAVLPLR
ncbi:Biosynthetic arginine decarboxylase [Stutzerimonas stutzeri]